MDSPIETGDIQQFVSRLTFAVDDSVELPAHLVFGEFLIDVFFAFQR